MKSPKSLKEEEEADAREAYEDFKKWLEAETIPPAQPNPSLEWPAKSQKPDVAVKSEPASSAASAFFEAAPESEKPCPVCKKDKVDLYLGWSIYTFLHSHPLRVWRWVHHTQDPKKLA